MTHEPEKAPPLADHDTATMSGKVYNQFRAAWERDRANAALQMLEALERICAYTRHDSPEHKIAQAAIAKARG
jgi:hypothetical protein